MELKEHKIVEDVNFPTLQIERKNQPESVCFNKIKKSKINLKHHVESIHEGKHFQCDQCEYEVGTRGGLWHHVKSKHGY